MSLLIYRMLLLWTEVSNALYWLYSFLEQDQHTVVMQSPKLLDQITADGFTAAHRHTGVLFI